jgi:hypothetical protein
MPVLQGFMEPQKSCCERSDFPIPGQLVSRVLISPGRPFLNAPRELGKHYQEVGKTSFYALFRLFSLKNLPLTALFSRDNSLTSAYYNFCLFDDSASPESTLDLLGAMFRQRSARRTAIQRASIGYWKKKNLRDGLGLSARRCCKATGNVGRTANTVI